jgi:POTRA domain, FtsQ-type
MSPRRLGRGSPTRRTTSGQRGLGAERARSAGRPASAGRAGSSGRARPAAGRRVAVGVSPLGRTLRALRWLTDRLVTPTRAAGLLGMLVSGYLVTLLTGPTAFGLSTVDVSSLRWTDPAAVRAALGVAAGTNVVRLSTASLAAAVRGLPAVADASVAVSLLDARLVVTIAERQPILGWRVGTTVYLVDRSGVLFAKLDPAAASDVGVPIVLDQRTASGGGLVVGDALDPIDLDVASRLGSLVPGDVGSSADRLQVAITDADGFVVRRAGGWVAVFGFYGPAIRNPDLIPGQVRLLRSLLATGESNVTRVILADPGNGTYVPRATPQATSR